MFPFDNVIMGKETHLSQKFSDALSSEGLGYYGMDKVQHTRSWFFILQVGSFSTCAQETLHDLCVGIDSESTWC